MTDYDERDGFKLSFSREKAQPLTKKVNSCCHFYYVNMKRRTEKTSTK